MNMHRHTTRAAVLLLLGSSTAAVAQYTGPREEKVPTVAQTVAEVLGNPANDRKVELTGVLVRQTGRESYLFRDATGEIQVEIDREDFPVGQPVGADTRVQLHGEVDKNWLRKPEVDVERLQLAAPAA